MGKETTLIPSEVVEKAVAFFGPSGYGMDVVDHGDWCARFEGAGGVVYVQAVDAKERDGSMVTVDGREWEYQIKQFMGTI